MVPASRGTRRSSDLNSATPWRKVKPIADNDLTDLSAKPPRVTCLWEKTDYAAKTGLPTSSEMRNQLSRRPNPLAFLASLLASMQRNTSTMVTALDPLGSLDPSGLPI